MGRQAIQQGHDGIENLLQRLEEPHRKREVELSKFSVPGIGGVLGVVRIEVVGAVLVRGVGARRARRAPSLTVDRRHAVSQVCPGRCRPRRRGRLSSLCAAGGLRFRAH